VFNTLDNLIKYIKVIKFLKRLLSLNIFLKKTTLYCLVNNLVIVSVLHSNINLYIIKLKLFSAFISIILDLIYF
jgi:hypothetical protein